MSLSTRERILNTAADLATTHGLEGLSFAQIAERLNLTKAGVARHFDGKADLQAATIDQVHRRYLHALQPAQSATPGVPRLRALMLAWLTFIEQIDYAGGCFFAATGNEFATRPGATRAAVAELTRELIAALEEQAQLARRLGEISADPTALVFRLHALAGEANLRRQLLDDDQAFALARTSASNLIDLACQQEATP